MPTQKARDNHTSLNVIIDQLILPQCWNEAGLVKCVKGVLKMHTHTHTGEHIEDLPVSVR